MVDDELDLDNPFDDEPAGLDFDTVSDEPASRRGKPGFNRRWLLVGLVALLIVCLVGAVIARVFLDGGEVAGTPPTVIPTPAQTEEPVVAPAPEEPTATPTQVVVQESTSAAETPATEPVPGPTATPLPAVSRPAPVVSFPPQGAGPGVVTNLLENGNFEAGFGKTGVAAGWNSFGAGEAVIAFSAETAPSRILAGSSAQRISIDRTTRQDQFAGLYQTVEVTPGQVYTLTLNGQIRSKPRATQYDYRLQYALDFSGGSNWQTVPAERWVELPWDEQDIDSSAGQFMTYSAVITPTTESLTLFVRAWHKWADGSLAEFTLDDLALTGQEPGAPAPSLPVADTGVPPKADEQLMPTTGFAEGSLLADGRFWGAISVLLALVGSAFYRGKRGD
jgi:hypothetical protein